MGELVIVSGKGGTGKTTIAASFAALAGKSVIVDCDVDASNLHLVLPHEVRRTAVFNEGYEARIDQSHCTRCGACGDACRFGAVRTERRLMVIDPIACEGCGACVAACPTDAVDMSQSHCGEWMVSNTSFGPMVHAQLVPGADNSGKLVTLLRTEARSIAESCSIDRIVVDAAPGIGCPVIASISGADSVLIVTEPSTSARHDLGRVITLCTHFNIRPSVCINRYDINPSSSEQVIGLTERSNARFVGRIPHDPTVVRAQLEATTVSVLGGPAAKAIESIWNTINQGEQLCV